MTSTRLSRDDDHAFLLDRYDTWMFDCDGVLWHGDTLVDGAVEVLKSLRSRSETVLPILREFFHADAESLF